MTYNITVDGHVIDTIDLPAMSQQERDAVRQDIANTYGVPRHYIRLTPQQMGKYGETAIV